MGKICYIDLYDAVPVNDTYVFDYDIEAAVRVADIVVVRERHGASDVDRRRLVVTLYHYADYVLFFLVNSDGTLAERRVTKNVLS